MGLYETLLTDLRDAMMSKNADRTRVLRSLKAAIQEKEISERKGGKATLNDDQIVGVLMKAAKQRKDSIEQFEKAKRTDLVDTEAMELEVIESYLPKMMNEGEIAILVDETMAKMGINSHDEMGKLMGTLMPKIKGRADGALVSKVVREKLSAG